MESRKRQLNHQSNQATNLPPVHQVDHSVIIDGHVPICLEERLGTQEMQHGQTGQTDQTKSPVPVRDLTEARAANPRTVEC